MGKPILNVWESPPQIFIDWIDENGGIMGPQHKLQVNSKMGHVRLMKGRLLSWLSISTGGAGLTSDRCGGFQSTLS